MLLVIALAVMLSFATTALAAPYQENEGASTYVVVLPPHVIEDPSGGGGYIGEFTIFSCSEGLASSWNTSGHAFLSFKNTSTSSVTIGSYEVDVDEEITIGTWGNQSQHNGVWYNLESYFKHSAGEFSGCASLTMNVTQADVDDINTAISNNDTWGIMNNCSSFASKVWNEVSRNTLSAGSPNTPTSLKTSIQAVSGYQMNREVQNNTNIGYTSNGQFMPVRTDDVKLSIGVTIETNVNTIAVALA